MLTRLGELRLNELHRYREDLGFALSVLASRQRLKKVNVKELVLLDDASDILVKQIKPNFKLLGPKFGRDMKLISNRIQSFTKEDISFPFP